MTDNTEPWQRVAREMGTWDFECELTTGEHIGAWMAEVSRHAEYVGQYVLAEPACREIANLRLILKYAGPAPQEMEDYERKDLLRKIANLRAILELVAGNLLAAKDKFVDAPMSAAAHLDEAANAVRYFTRGDEYSELAKDMRQKLWASTKSESNNHD